MFFRFGSALALIVLVCLAGVALEKQNLALRRALSLQQSRADILLDSYARLRLKTQQMADPARLWDSLQTGERPAKRAKTR